MAEKEQLTIDLTLKVDDKYKSELDKVVSDTVKKVTDANKSIIESEDEKAKRIAATTKLIKKMDEINSSVSKRGQQMRQAEIQAQNNLNASINNTASSIKSVEKGLKDWLGITLTEEYKAANGMTSLGDAASTTKNEVESLNTTLRQTATDVKNISKESSKITKLYKGRWAAGNIRKIASSVAGYMDAGDESGSAGQLVEGAAGIASSSMIGFSVAGPLGATVGGLTTAGTLLINAATEQKKAAIELMNSNKSKYQAYVDILNDMTKKEDAEKRFSEYAKGLSGSNSMQTAYDIRERIAELESTIAGRQSILDEVNADLKTRKGAAEENIKNSEWWNPYSWGKGLGPDAKERTIARIYGEKGKNLSDLITDQVAAKEELPRLQKLLEDWQKANRELGNALRGSTEAAKEAAQEATTKIDWKAEFAKATQTLYKKYSKEKNSVENQLAGINNSKLNYSLTDSLTQIGGGSGYYGQMNGVYSSVTNIQKTLQTKLNEITSKMDILTKNNPNLGATYG